MLKGKGEEAFVGGLSADIDEKERNLCFKPQVNACKHACPLHACMGLDVVDVFKGGREKRWKGHKKNIIDCFL